MAAYNGGSICIEQTNKMEQRGAALVDQIQESTPSVSGEDTTPSPDDIFTFQLYRLRNRRLPSGDVRLIGLTNTEQSFVRGHLHVAN
jgi:hypothetical protein